MNSTRIEESFLDGYKYIWESSRRIDLIPNQFDVEVKESSFSIEHKQL